MYNKDSSNNIMLGAGMGCCFPKKLKLLLMQ